jgi:adenine-specific DNA-methyltransferase
MIYIDPPYGVRFGSNFQPFVRKPKVDQSNKDDEMTREPEMVKAYRDTWELGLHSYLTYLRDRLLLARELLHQSGSMFVQISDDNIHHVRELLDEILGPRNFVSQILFRKTGGLQTTGLASVGDYLLWYAKDKTKLKYRQLYLRKKPGEAGATQYRYVLENGLLKSVPEDELSTVDPLLLACHDNLTSQGNPVVAFEFEGNTYKSNFKPTLENLSRLAGANRLIAVGKTLRYIRYLKDFPVFEVNELWEDVGISGFADQKLYVVQTSPEVVKRCILMTTDPGDLVFDPTCGSGTTAYVAEQWGRRWITCDTSRVPLALARQRLLTATFPYYELKDPKAGPAGGFIYKRRQNKKGEEVGGLLPHITLKSIAREETPVVEVLVDRPDELSAVTRVSGPFVVEATIAPAQSLDVAGERERTFGDVATHIERMTEVLRQSRTLKLPANRELVLSGIRRLADCEYLHAEAKEGDRRIAIVFGPQDGAISSSLVFEAVREAYFLKYDLIYFFGFAIEANARGMIEDEKKLRIPAVYVAVTPDVAMSDLLKTTRASEIFSITGLPDFEIKRTKKKGSEGQPLFEVELKGLDIFDPESLDTQSVNGENVPCWMLDTDYDGMSFYATQVFFPKTSAWDNLQKSLKATFDETVWRHLAGTTSEPFAIGDKKRLAVKVIDERGNELLRVKDVEV